jgi:CMD domain protein
VTTETTAPASAPIDTFDVIARVQPGSPAARLRARRPDLTRFSQASYGSLFEPVSDEGLSLRERFVVALRIALAEGDDDLAAWYRERLLTDGGTAHTTEAVHAFPAASPELSAREVALLRHADLLTTRPTEADRPDIAALRDAGLTTREIVTLSQLIAFVAFQVRVLATLRAFGVSA